MDNVSIILVFPKYPENIGASARVACNFGIRDITVVSNREPDQERMLKMATHKAAHLIREMRVVATSKEAAEPFNFIVATTAKNGRQRLRCQTPRAVMEEISPLVAAPENRIALMFGPENNGLCNEDMDLCQFASTIPTADFSSLNLAQAIAIHCYELYTAMPAVKTKKPDREIEFANSFDREGMYTHIAKALSEITFLDDNNQTHWMRNIRQFLNRIHLSKKDTSLIRGICRKFLWHSASEIKLEKK